MACFFYYEIDIFYSVERVKMCNNICFMMHVREGYVRIKNKMLWDCPGPRNDDIKDKSVDLIIVYYEPDITIPFIFYKLIL